MTQQITVKSGYDDNRVALWERHPGHPNGELFVAGPAPVQAAKTATVLRKLGSGALVEVAAGISPAPKKTPLDAPPWPDYDAMTAGEVIEWLEDLPEDERAELLDAARRYEEAHKARKTVLEALS